MPVNYHKPDTQVNSENKSVPAIVGRNDDLRRREAASSWTPGARKSHMLKKGHIH
jgi:hypothetical protein